MEIPENWSAIAEGEAYKDALRVTVSCYEQDKGWLRDTLEIIEDMQSGSAPWLRFPSHDDREQLWHADERHFLPALTDESREVEGIPGFYINGFFRPFPAADMPRWHGPARTIWAELPAEWSTQVVRSMLRKQRRAIVDFAYSQKMELVLLELEKEQKSIMARSRRITQLSKRYAKAVERCMDRL